MAIREYKVNYTDTNGSITLLDNDDIIFSADCDRELMISELIDIVERLKDAIPREEEWIEHRAEKRDMDKYVKELMVPRLEKNKKRLADAEMIVAAIEACRQEDWVSSCEK